MAIQADHHVDVHESSLEQGVLELIPHCSLRHNRWYHRPLMV